MFDTIACVRLVFNVRVYVLALAVSSLLKGELQLKSSVPLQSPTFPAPGSTLESAPRPVSPDMPTQSAHTVSLSPAPPEEKECSSANDPTMFYTPDDEEPVQAPAAEEENAQNPDTSSFVPPFNNPLYPNCSYTTYGSVIGNVYFHKLH